MYVFGKKARSWRKGKKRGVSPIIATILLVAITVVLAAVLYVLISGLTHGSGSAPLGTNFGWGTATPAHPPTGTIAPTGCVASAPGYVFSIASASGVTAGDIGFSLRTSSGTSVSAAPIVTLWSLTGTTFSAKWVTDGSGPSTGGSSPLNSTDTIVVDLGAVGSISGLGDSFEAVAIASYAGTVSIALP